MGKKVSNRGAAVLGVAAGVEKSKAKGGGGRLCLGFLGLGLGFPLLFFLFFFNVIICHITFILIPLNVLQSPSEERKKEEERIQATYTWRQICNVNK